MYNDAIRVNAGYAPAYDGRGNVLSQRQEFDQAINDFGTAIRLDSNNAGTFYNRGTLLLKRGKYFDAITDLETAVRREPRHVTASNDLAWLLATCPVEAFRDGKKAVKYGLAACTLSEFKDSQHLDTLAAAYAEQGQFDKAVETQNNAIKISSKSGGSACFRQVCRASSTLHR